MFYIFLVRYTKYGCYIAIQLFFIFIKFEFKKFTTNAIIRVDNLSFKLLLKKNLKIYRKMR